MDTTWGGNGGNASAAKSKLPVGGWGIVLVVTTSGPTSSSFFLRLYLYKTNNLSNNLKSTDKYSLKY